MNYLHSLPSDLWKELIHYHVPTIGLTRDISIPGPIRTKNLIFFNIHIINLIDNINYIEAENVFYEYCDKYVTKYSLKTPNRFHNLKRLYLNSSPADYDAFTQFYVPRFIYPSTTYLTEEYKDLHIFVHERFQRYYE